VTGLPSGDLDIGPSNGHLRLRTYREGLAARAGHDLVLEAAEWHGRVHLPSDAGGSASVDAGAGGSASVDAGAGGSASVDAGAGGSAPVDAGAGGSAPVDAPTGAGIEVEVEVDLRRLEVREGTGGVKPLTEKDKADIRKAMGKQLRVDDQPMATFRSSSVRVEGERATVEGELSIAGQSHPLVLDVRRETDGTITGATQVVQSSWGIKPYSGFFGALKLRDAVDVEFSLQLPG
jgi:hypothetical protein